VEEGIKKGASYSIRKTNKATSLEDAKKERMHRFQRIKGSPDERAKDDKNRSWSSCCRKEPKKLLQAAT
jgi:hypothetical protein